MILVTFGDVQLYDVTNGIRLLFLKIFEKLGRSALSKLLALSIFFCVTCFIVFLNEFFHELF